MTLFWDLVPNLRVWLQIRNTNILVFVSEMQCGFISAALIISAKNC